MNLLRWTFLINLIMLTLFMRFIKLTRPVYCNKDYYIYSIYFDLHNVHKYVMSIKIVALR